MQFNWLHITDLHHGMANQGWLLPGLQHRLFEDLRYLYSRCGPWDLILFTGDLTQRGTKEEFDAVDELLDRLLKEVQRLQSGTEPLVLAVPGNHDLQRPKDAKAIDALLGGWQQVPAMKERLWDGSDPTLHDMLGESFSEYETWWARRRARAAAFGVAITPGRLPGDFAATIEKADCKLGIMGLNTSFLHLRDGLQGRLAVHADQFNHAAWGRDGEAWARQHAACLLLTHHP